MNGAHAGVAGATLRRQGARTHLARVRSHVLPQTANPVYPPFPPAPMKRRTRTRPPRQRMDDGDMNAACERLRRVLADNLRVARRTAGLTQQAVEDMTGVGAANISRIEGATWNVSIDTVAKIAAALGVEPGRLFVAEEPKTEP